MNFTPIWFLVLFLGIVCEKGSKKGIKAEFSEDRTL